jgi:hypothetical protein
VALSNKESGAKVPEKTPDPARDDLTSLTTLLDFDVSRRQRLLDLNPHDAEVLLQVATKVRASLDALIIEARERLGKTDDRYAWAEAFAESFQAAAYLVDEAMRKAAEIDRKDAKKHLH